MKLPTLTMTQRLRVLTVALISAILTVASYALAVTYRNYHPLSCYPADGNSAVGAHGYLYATNNGNNAAIYCPMIQDSYLDLTQGSGGTSTITGTVYIYAGATGSPPFGGVSAAACRLYSAGTGGTCGSTLNGAVAGDTSISIAGANQAGGWYNGNIDNGYYMYVVLGNDAGNTYNNALFSITTAN